jgi:hypothetical protein
MSTRKPSAQPLARLLETRSGALARIIHHSDLLRRLAVTVSGALPDPLRMHCRVANLKGNLLVIQTDSPTWSVRLRYHIPVLLDHLRRAELPGLGHIRIRVKPPEPPPVAPRARPRITRRTAELLRSAAAATSDSELGAALLRLSRHT